MNIIADGESSGMTTPWLNSIKICNSFGAIMIEMTTSDDNPNSINVQELNPGIYTIYGFDFDGKIYQGKLVKL